MSPALGEGCSSSWLKPEGEFLTLCTWSCVAIRGDLKGILNHRAGVDALLTRLPPAICDMLCCGAEVKLPGTEKTMPSAAEFTLLAWRPCLRSVSWVPDPHRCRDWLVYVSGAFLVYSGTLGACVSVCEHVCDSFLEFMESEGLQGWWVNLKTALYLQTQLA